MDWQLNDGRIEVVQGGRGHELQLLSHQMRSGNGRFRMSVRTGALRDPSQQSNLGATGFRFAVTGAMPEEYRSNLFGSNGVNAGITTDGRLFVGNKFSSDSINASHLEDIRLEIEINCRGANAEATINALPVSGSNRPLGSFSATVKSDPLIGCRTIQCLSPCWGHRRFSILVSRLVRFWQ